MLIPNGIDCFIMKKFHYFALICFIVASATLISATNAFANDDSYASTAKIKSLEARIEVLEQLLNKQLATRHNNSNIRDKQAIWQHRSTATITTDKRPNILVAKPQPSQEIKANNPKTITINGKHSFKVTGRMMVDHAFYNDDAFDYADGSVLRRLWVGLEGHVDKDWFWRAEPDFAGNRVTLRDAYIRYKGFKTFNINLGQHLEPFGMSALTSSKYLTFIERGLPFALEPDRRLGFSISTKNAERWAVHTGIFGSTAGTNSPNDDEGYSFSLRGHYNPMLRGSDLVHLGAAVSYRHPDADTIRYRSQPEAAVDDNRIVDTGDILDVDNIHMYSLEFAGQHGATHFQSQYDKATINRGDNPDADFSSWYVNLGHFLTADSRNYSTKSGVFGRVNPTKPMGAGGYGAWEIAARYSELDLNDANIQGGEVKNTTLGLNWYPNSWLKFMVNYIMVDGDEHTKTAAGDDPEILLIRSQVEF
jgi:phosphate-selective porin OprO/OprP